MDVGMDGGKGVDDGGERKTLEGSNEGVVGRAKAVGME